MRGWVCLWVVRQMCLCVDGRGDANVYKCGGAWGCKCACVWLAVGMQMCVCVAVCGDTNVRVCVEMQMSVSALSLIRMSEPTRLLSSLYEVVCL